MHENWMILNGNFCQEKDAFIPVTDRGFLFGEGIFTTIRVAKGKCEFFQEHLQRLQEHAEVLHLTWKPLKIKFIEELIERNQAFSDLWRLKIMITADEKEGKREVGQVIVMMQKSEDLSFLPCTLSFFPYPIENPLAHIKSLSYLDHLYVREYARKSGHDDAITQTGQGFLLETGCSNLFWIAEDTCWIPDKALPYLKGIFLRSILPHLALPIEWTFATIDEIPSNASVYICNSVTHIRPVLSIDNRCFPRNRPVEDLLQQATVQALQGNN